MTDEQIIKALGCLLCGNVGQVCKGCVNLPFKGAEIKVEDFHSLIQRQKAEIERLTERLEREAKCKYDLCGQIADLKEQLKTARADAVREFAERLLSDVVTFGDIERVLREMKEGENGK